MRATGWAGPAPRTGLPHVGDRIRVLRLNQGWTVAAAARKVGVSASLWSAWETGKRFLRRTDAEHLDLIFDLPEGTVEGWIDESEEQ